MDKLYFWNLLHSDERKRLLEELSNKAYLRNSVYAVLISIFVMFTPLVLVVNAFIIFFLYKSIWAIFLGIVLVYLIVMCLWMADYLFMKYSAPSLLAHQLDFYKFYNIVAALLSVAMSIYILIEVL